MEPLGQMLTVYRRLNEHIRIGLKPSSMKTWVTWFWASRVES